MSRRKRLAFALATLLLVGVVLELALWSLSWLVSGAARTGPADGGDVRVLCVGDSYTYGVYVDRGLSYPAQLARALNELSDREYAVVNAGWPGQNSAQVLRKLEDQIAEHDPSIVIALAGLNNAWNAAESEGWGGTGAVSRVDRWLAAHLRTYRLLRLIELQLRLAASERAGGATEAVRREPIFDEDFLEGTTRNDFVAMAELSARRGVRFISASYPHPEGGGGYVPVFNAAMARAAELSSAEHVEPAVATRTILSRYEPGDLFFADLHPKIAVYHLMALDLAAHVLGLGELDREAAHARFMAEHGAALDRTEDGSYFNLYNEFARAEKRAGPGGPARAALERVDAPSTEGAPAGTWSFSLLLPPGAEVLYRSIEMPAGASLRVGFSVDASLWQAAPGTARASLRFLEPQTGRPLWTRDLSLDPDAGPRRVVVHRLDLSALAGRSVDLAIAAAAGDPRRATGHVLLVQPAILAPRGP